MTTYSKRYFLNKKKSASTGSIAVFAGQAPWSKKKEKTYFIEVADCHQSARLHRCAQDTSNDYIAKLEKMIKVLKHYKKHLKKHK